MKTTTRLAALSHYFKQFPRVSFAEAMTEFQFIVLQRWIADDEVKFYTACFMQAVDAKILINISTRMDWVLMVPSPIQRMAIFRTLFPDLATATQEVIDWFFDTHSKDKRNQRPFALPIQ
jgi:hypothetical protein